MICLKKPSNKTISAFLWNSNKAPFTYTEIGQSTSNEPVKGYDNDFNRIKLGSGQAVFDTACAAIRQWKMFPRSWAYIEPHRPPIEVGQTVAMVARVMGIYWVNDCRIVYTLDDKNKSLRRYGFAYGTLGEHIERGEELFCIEWLEDDSVWYVIRAFSKPRFWLVKLAYPMARMYQRKFVRESKRAMLQAVNELV
jgi:uncharacterized protein (UPF0548 family)